MKWNKVSICEAWGPGSDHSLSTPLGRLPEFWLRPRYLHEAGGKRHIANYAVEFSSGFLGDGWQGVTLTPMGKNPVKGIITNLPPWDPGQSALYRKAIHDADGVLGDSGTERLEAIIPYLEGGSVGYNTVRLFLVSGACKGSAPDLVVVRIGTHTLPPGTVRARQDGTAHGPPG